MSKNEQQDPKTNTEPTPDTDDKPVASESGEQEAQAQEPEAAPEASAEAQPAAEEGNAEGAQADAEASQAEQATTEANQTEQAATEVSPELEQILQEVRAEADEQAASEASAEPTAQTEQAEQGATTIPPHFEPIPQDKLKRAKRTRRILVAIIVLLILVLLSAVAGAVYYYLNYTEPPPPVESTPAEIEATDTVQDRGTTETIAMPNLLAMFGKTPEEVVATLGSNYTITKTEGSSGDTSSDDPEAAEGEEGEESTDTSGIVAMSTISYTPDEDSGATGAKHVQNIYLSLNAQGMTVEVYFVSSMSLLDYPTTRFEDLVMTKDSFVDTLSNAGVAVAADAAYTPPTSEDYNEYVDADGDASMIKKQSATFKGAVASEQAPTKFEITYTYEYGATGVEDTPDKQPSQRMLYIKLS